MRSPYARAVRAWVAKTLLIAVLGVALMSGAPLGGAAAAEVQPAEERLILMVVGHKQPGSSPEQLNGSHVLTLTVYPLRGVAIADTASNDYDVENKLSAGYVEQIPKGPFDGHLDLDFPGLGSFVGDFVAKETRAKHRPKGCVGPPGSSQLGELEGAIEFHGGGFAPWSAPHAVAFLERSPRLHCRAGAAEPHPEAKTLFGYLDHFASFNNWRYSLRATLRRPHRATELAVFGYEGRPQKVNFDAATYEWLPGGIATGRFVDRSSRGVALLEAGHGGLHPARATLRPPGPYSGVGTYSRSTHRLTGSLAVQFPGLKLRLGSAATVADLIDEAGRAGRASR